MDLRQGYGQRPGQRRKGPPPANPQLFEDTSTPQQPTMMYTPNQEYMQPGPSNQSSHYGYSYPDPQQGAYDQSSFGSPQPQTSQQMSQQQMGGNMGGNMGQAGQYGGQQFMNDPMANMAMQYGHSLAGQGKEYVNKNIEKYVSTSKLKYYFAVDTTYVGKKLGLLLFPFTHSDWSIQYNQDEPVAPRYEINAPDLYIPVMAFVTYILLAGLVLGTQNRFTPEQLGMTCSTAMVWMVIEILALLLSMYILNVTTDLKYLDITAYCGYKYVGMIMCLLASLAFNSIGYYIALLWTSITLSFFLMRSLKFAIIPHTSADTYTKGGKRQLYMLLVIALVQPIFMWWLTYHLVTA